MAHQHNPNPKFSLPSKQWLALLSLPMSLAGAADLTAQAQVIPDATLGAESSVVVPDYPLKGRLVEHIEGGATRGSNLFHSFSQFNVDAGTPVYFANPTGIENILSRVTGGALSRIDGLLGVDGAANLFLLNSNGVWFGPNAQLDLGGNFVASTAGRVDFSDGGAFSAINPRGSAFLTMSAPLGVQRGLQPLGDVTNEGSLAVDAGKSLTLFGQTTLNQGRLQAAGGRVELLGDRVGLAGSSVIEVSGETNGGTVLVGGGFQGNGTVPNASRSFVGPDVQILANAGDAGDGGRVIVWADESTRFYGNAMVQGGRLSGDGGFVEVSGKESLDFQGAVDASAARGEWGTLLLDPSSITINDTGTTTLDNVDMFSDPDIDGVGAIINADLINRATTNVVLEATGDINFDSAVNIAAEGVGLSAAAGAGPTGDGTLNVNVNAPITTNDGDISLTGNASTLGAPGVVITQPISSGAGRIMITGSGRGDDGIRVANTISSTSGNIQLTGECISDCNGSGVGTGAEGIRLIGGSVITDGGDINLDGSSIEDDGFQVADGGQVTSNGGSITIKGVSQSPDPDDAGVEIAGVIDSGGGVINITGDGSAQSAGVVTTREIKSGIGSITMTGSSVANDGVQIGNKITSQNNVITISGTSESTQAGNEGVEVAGAINSAGGEINIIGEGNGTLSPGVRSSSEVSAREVSFTSTQGSLILENNASWEANDVELTADNIQFQNRAFASNISNSLTIQPNTSDLPIVLVNEAQGVANTLELAIPNLTNINTSSFSGNAPNLIIGREDGSGSIRFAGGVNFSPLSLTLRAPAGNAFVDTREANLSLGGALVIDSATTVQLGPISSFTFPININAGGEIIGESLINTSGTTLTFSSDSDIMLTNLEGLGLVAVRGQNALLRSDNSIFLESANLSGDLQVTARNADIVSVGNLIVEGTTSLDAGANIRLDAENDFNKIEIISGQNNNFFSQATVIRDINDVQLGASNIRDGLTLTAGGNISSGERIDSNQTTFISENGDINLDNPANRLQAISLTSQNATIKNIETFLNEATIAENLTIESDQDITVVGTATVGDSLTLRSNQDVAILGDIAVGNSLTISAGGTIEQFEFGGGSIVVTSPEGVASFSTSQEKAGNVAITNSSNTNFTNSLIGGDLTVRFSPRPNGPSRSSVTGFVNLAGQLNRKSSEDGIPLPTDERNLTGKPTSRSLGNGSFLVEGNGTINLSEIAGLPSTVKGDLEVISSTGARFQEEAFTQVDAIKLNQPGNQFEGLVSVTTRAPRRDTEPAAITQSEALIISGNTMINAGRGPITLDNEANDFRGSVSLREAERAVITDSNLLTLSEANSLGDITLTANKIETTLPDSRFDRTLGDIILTADEIEIETPIKSPDSRVTLQPLTPSTDIRIGGAGSPLSSASDNLLELSQNELNRLDDVSRLVIGRDDSSGSIKVPDGVIFRAPVTLQAPEGRISLTNPDLQLKEGSQAAIASIRTSTAQAQTNPTDDSRPLSLIARNIDITATTPGKDLQFNNSELIGSPSEGSQSSVISITNTSGGDILVQDSFIRGSAPGDADDLLNGSRIVIDASGEILRLVGASEILTQGGINSLVNDGGVIELNVTVINADNGDNSDIVSGRFINIDTLLNNSETGLVNIAERPKRTGNNDLTATGFINFIVPKIDPTQGLIEFPDLLIDPSNKIAVGCRPERRFSDRETGKFVITGPGGLPLPPNDIINNRPLDDLGASTTFVNSDFQKSSNISNLATSSQDSTSPSSSTHPLADAKGAVVSPTGEIFLVTQVPRETTVHNTWSLSSYCSALNKSKPEK